MVLLRFRNVDVELGKKFLKERSGKRDGESAGLVVVVAVTLQGIKNAFKVLCYVPV